MNLTPNGFLKQQHQQQLANPKSICLFNDLPSGNLILKMAIEIVDFPIENGDFPSFLWGCQLQTLFLIAEILPASELTNIGAYDLAGELGDKMAETSRIFCR